MFRLRKSRPRQTISLLFVLCLSCPLWASDPETSGDAIRPRASRYVFAPSQSTLLQTGGIAGVHWTYRIEGGFVLSLYRNLASFVQVDANATDDSPYRRTLDPNEVFAMTSLDGKIIDSTTLSFTGKAADGSAVKITVTLQDGSAHLIAETTPPPGSADFFVFSMDATAPRKYAGGTGVQGDSYQIATAADLIALGAEPNDYDKHFLLTADIDLDPNLPGRKVFDKAVIAYSTYPSFWEGRGMFSGDFDGNGHSIANMTIKGVSCLGLFGRLASSAEIRNLGIVDVDIRSTGSGVGALVGDNSGSLTHCYSTGSLNAGEVVGGLVGRSLYGSVAFCCTSASVSARSVAGGLVGANEGGFIGQCLSSGKVTGQYSTGGLVGGTNMYPNHVTGGLWDVQTSGQTTSQGGLGKTTAEMLDIETYLAAGWDFVDEIANGTSQVWRMPEGGGYPVLAIFSRGALAPLRGLGTRDAPYLISSALELGAMSHCSRGACFRLTGPIDLSGTRWRLPVISAFSGTFDGNGLTISHLTMTSEFYAGLFGRLDTGSLVENLGVVDVNVSGSGSVGALAGSNGDSNYEIIDTNGLAHWEAEGGTIACCHSTGRVYSDTAAYVGGLVGYSCGGNFTRCYSSTAVTGPVDVGGLVGRMSGGAATQCCSTADVTTMGRLHPYVGGLMGENWGGTLDQCYSGGSINGHLSPAGTGGGLIGLNRATSVTNCYSTTVNRSDKSLAGGLIGLNIIEVRRDGWTVGEGNFPNCFWDMQASGMTTSFGGIGKTTAEMKQAKTFTDAGWDFVGETKNGTEDIWWIDEGKDYPRLGWEPHATAH